MLFSIITSFSEPSPLSEIIITVPGFFVGVGIGEEVGVGVSTAADIEILLIVLCVENKLRAGDLIRMVPSNIEYEIATIINVL